MLVSVCVIQLKAFLSYTVRIIAGGRVRSCVALPLMTYHFHACLHPSPNAPIINLSDHEAFRKSLCVDWCVRARLGSARPGWGGAVGTRGHARHGDPEYMDRGACCWR